MKDERHKQNMPLELSRLDLRECILHFNTTLFFRSPHEIMEEMLQRCPEGCRNFIRAQLSEAGKKDRGRRFNRHMKDLGLQLLHSSPKAYRQMKAIFSLPSGRTLRRYVSARVGYFSVNTNLLNKTTQLRPVSQF